MIIERIKNWICRECIQEKEALMKDYEELNNKLKDTEFELNLLEKEYVDLESKYILLKNENEELNENQKRNQRKN